MNYNTEKKNLDAQGEKGVGEELQIASLFIFIEDNPVQILISLRIKIKRVACFILNYPGFCWCEVFESLENYSQKGFSAVHVSFLPP